MAYGSLNAGAITPGSGNTLTIAETVTLSGNVASTGTLTVTAPTANLHASTKAYVDTVDATQRTYINTVATAATTAAQGVGTGNAVTFATVNTGQGAVECYAMDQTVLIASLPTFAGVKLAASGGINFSGYATSGNPSSNLLNDYEEGNWTPACSAATIQVVNATYTKIGNSVRLGAYINIDSTGSGDFALTGVPFTNTSVGGAAGAVFIRNFSANKNGSVAAVIGGGTTVYLRVGMQDNAGAYLLNEVADTVSFWLGITYETSA